MHETLCSAEEMIKAIDCGDYFSIPADMRDHKYVNSNTNIGLDESSSYASNNTEMLEGESLDHLLLKQPYIVQELTKTNG